MFNLLFMMICNTRRSRWKKKLWAAVADYQRGIVYKHQPQSKCLWAQQTIMKDFPPISPASDMSIKIMLEGNGFLVVIPI